MKNTAIFNLMPNEILNEVPKLYANENIKKWDTKVYAIYIVPGFSWTWYLTEYDGKDLAYGLVAGAFVEWGYFSLRELRKIGARRFTLISLPKTFKKLKDIELVNNLSDDEMIKAFYEN